MAILSISRVQVRRGLQEDLPQLASGEMGWSLDQRRLYIGNGTTEEGAPSLGNTEILTQYSDMLSLSGLYTYKGEEAGYTVMTGATSLSQVERSLQNKLDDFVNGRDFGITGDGVTNDVDAINHAIEQLHKEAVLADDWRVRRTLRLSAGIYVLSGDFIRLSPYVKIMGEGKYATQIIQTDESQPCAMMTVSAGSVLPGINAIERMAVKNATSNDVVIIDSAAHFFMDRVWMQGPIDPATNIIGSGSSKACVRIDQSNSEISNYIFFSNCTFSDQDYAIFADKPVQNIVVSAGNFNHLYKGVDVGANPAGIGNIKISNSIFDTIYAEGFVAQNGVANCSSSYNTYINVGNGAAIVDGGATYSNVVKFTGPNSYSIGDMFGRAEDAEFAAINMSNEQSYAVLPNGRSQVSRTYYEGGRAYVIAADSEKVPLGILNSNATNMSCNYVITRDSDSRTGTIKILTNGTSLIYDDTYLETDDVGVTLFPALSGGYIDLTYSSTVGNAGSITISKESLI